MTDEKGYDCEFKKVPVFYESKEEKHGGDKDPWEGIQHVTTMHGLDKVTDNCPIKTRKWVWLSVIIISLCIFGYQATLRLLYFMGHPVNMNYQVINNQSLLFPKVVICNQNSFRLSAAAGNGWYYLLEDLYSRSNISTFDPALYDATDISIEDIFAKTAHRIDDMMVTCEWNGQPCGVEDFEMMYTDHGLCYAFNGDIDNPLYITETGSSNGLRLTLNVEQYEYMAGPNHAAGLKVLVVGQGEVAFVEDLGDTVPTGLDALIAVYSVKETQLPEPHGSCNPDPLYSRGRCFDECRAEDAFKSCGCIHFYMNLDGKEIPICTLGEYTCLKRAMKIFNLQNCDCPTQCQSSRYDSIINYASTPSSEEAIAVNRTTLSKQHLIAKETAQRVTKRIVKEDTNLVQGVLEAFAYTKNATKKLMDIMSSLKVVKRTMSTQLTQRIWFHRVWGLEKVDFTIDNDFVRLWEVIDERTFMHVTTGFYQITALFRDMINKTLDPDVDANNKAIWHQMTERTLLERINLVQRALSNLTIIENAFSFGEPQFKFRKSPQRLYDEIWIPYEIFHESALEKKLMTKWKSYLNILTTELTNFMRYSDDAYYRNTVDHEAIEASILLFEKRCRSHNYYRYQYRYRIVKPCKDATVENLEHFQHLSQSFMEMSMTFDMAISAIVDKIVSFQENSGYRLSNAIQQALSYLEDSSFQKLQVAEFISNKEMWFDLNAIATMFKDVRSRSISLHDDWNLIEHRMLDIWQTMLEEPWTSRFYERLSNEMDSNKTEELIPVWEEILDMNLNGVTISELKTLMNADFPSINKTLFLEKKETEFGDLMAEHDVFEVIGDHADHFVNSFEELQRMLETYKKSTELDAAFFSKNFLRLTFYVKSLTYEFYEYQKAYDIVALLSDVGGTLSLWVGASVITLCEVADAIVISFLRLYRRKNSLSSSDR